jgi:lysozyme
LVVGVAGRHAAPAQLTVSPQGIVALAGHEGIVPAPYLDSVGVWTWGVGHTAAAGTPFPEGMPKGMPKDVDKAVDEALRLFRSDLAKYEQRVRSAVKAPLSQHQFDALVSFDFNTGGIYRAQLTGAINARDPDASRHFMGWLRPPEIRGRREAERHLFDTGLYPSKPVPVWNVDAKGKLRGIHSRVTPSELLRRMGA